MLTVEEAATLLRVKPWTIRHEIAAGRLRAVRVGRQWRTTVAWVNAYLDANATGPEVNDAEALRGWIGVPAESGRQVGGDVGDSREGPPPKVGGSRHVRGSDPADAGRPAGRGVIELQVAKADQRNGRRVPRGVAS